jgi:enamine deaminase RidA (YjgF/YER057c/UK114 family)
VRDHELVFVSGQVAVDAEGSLVGAHSHEAQTAQIAHNIGLVLASLGVDRDAIVKETVYVVGFEPSLLQPIFATLRSGGPRPPASTLVGVAALFHPDALVEVEIVVALAR